jgi:hypothetical protein
MASSKVDQHQLQTMMPASSEGCPGSQPLIVVFIKI